MAKKKSNDRGDITWVFGDFRFQPAAARLTSGGSDLHLPPKEAALLELLLSNHGRVVAHRDIWGALWPGQDVSYESLTRCVYALRRALDDHASSLVVTVPRRGYIINVPVSIEAPPRRVSSVIEKSTQTTPAAHATYQQGLHEARLTGPANQRRAVELFERAHALDPARSSRAAGPGPRAAAAGDADGHAPERQGPRRGRGA